MFCVNQNLRRVLIKSWVVTKQILRISFFEPEEIYYQFFSNIYLRNFQIAICLAWNNQIGLQDFLRY